MTVELVQDATARLGLVQNSGHFQTSKDRTAESQIRKIEIALVLSINNSNSQYIDKHIVCQLSFKLHVEILILLIPSFKMLEFQFVRRYEVKGQQTFYCLFVHL